ncbi:DNA-directed RNA polymerase I subunit RPA43-like [Acanthaster planci]|uniref:DNA-directed RNA polymerase I subunit RPA43 n=1 Tax=Acanthaster planci TaxID=133434 RepID=A0A8B7XUG0_ACAPL|nr:DNA-directed RNA polymerase I subunit RPA43-like [Acanthaster planci]
MNALEVFRTFEKAAELAKEPHSGCTLASAQRHIALSPRYIGRLRTGVGEILDAELGRFSESLQGVLLAYGNLKLLQSSGVIVDDSPFIHFDVKFDAVVFNPKIGRLLKCVVNEQAADHVGCLAHDWFNVSLLASRRELSDQKLEPGYVILVQVERLRALNGMLAVEGRAPDDGSDLIVEAQSLQSQETDSESNVDSILQPPLSDALDSTGTSTITPEKEARSKKKKKKHSKVEKEDVDFLETSVSYTPDASGVSAVTPETEPRSRKKKHVKVKQESEVDALQRSKSDPLDYSETASMTPGEEARNEKKKKRKHVALKQETDPGPSTETADTQTSGVKKKKKHKVKQELQVDSLKSPLSLDNLRCEQQTGGETTNCKKPKRTEVTEEVCGLSTPAGEEVSPGKKREKKKHVKNEADSPDSELTTRDSGSHFLEVTTDKKTSSTKKKKGKEIGTDVASHQPPCIANGPVAGDLIKDEDVVSNLQPLVNEQVSLDEKFTKLKKRKHRDKENHTALDSCLQPLSSDISSVTEQAAFKKVKKHKKKIKQENDDYYACSQDTRFVKKEPGIESNDVNANAVTAEADTEVEVQRSHKKHKGRGRSLTIICLVKRKSAKRGFQTDIQLKLFAVPLIVMELVTRLWVHV